MKTRAKDDSTPRSRSGTDEGLGVLATLIGGFVIWGGIGWLLDQWWGTKFLTPVGLVVGMGLGIYAVVARNWTAEADPAVVPQRRKKIVPTPGKAEIANFANQADQEPAKLPDA